MVGKLLGKAAELAAQSVDREIDRVAVVGRDRLGEQQRETADVLEAGRHAVAVERLARVADRAKIGDDVSAVLRRQPELVYAVEMVNDLIEAVVAAVVEIGRVEVRIE